MSARNRLERGEFTERGDIAVEHDGAAARELPGARRVQQDSDERRCRPGHLQAHVGGHPLTGIEHAAPDPHRPLLRGIVHGDVGPQPMMIEIFRIENGRIAENWALGQGLPYSAETL